MTAINRRRKKPVDPKPGDRFELKYLTEIFIFGNDI